MPYPNEHAARLNNPDKYPKKRRQNDKFGSGIDVIWGIKEDGSTEVQAIRFDKSKFTVAEARKWLTGWLKENGEYKLMGFEPAEDSETNQELDYGEIIQFSNAHDAIIQTLDRKVKGVEYPPELYEQAIKNTSIPLVFAKTHPDPYLYEVDPEAALQKVGGRHVGFATDGHVITKGHPRAMAKLHYDDSELDALYENGNLSLSPAVWRTKNENGETTGVRLQNILLFPEDDIHVPGDKGTFILNQEANMTGDKVEALLREQIDAKDKELNKVRGEFSTFQEKSKELETQITTFQDEIKTLKEENADLKKTIIEQDKTKDFAMFMEKIPDGMKHTDEQKDALKEKFMSSDKAGRGIMLEMATFMSANRLPETQETGNSNYETFQAENDDAEIAKIQADLRKLTGKV